MICVLLLAAGEAWESPAMADLEAHPGVVVLKRCVDVDDLLVNTLGATGGPSPQVFMLAIWRASEICLGIVLPASSSPARILATRSGGWPRPSPTSREALPADLRACWPVPDRTRRTRKRNGASLSAK